MSQPISSREPELPGGRRKAEGPDFAPALAGAVGARAMVDGVMDALGGRFGTEGPYSKRPEALAGAVPGLISALADADREVRGDAARMLHRLGPAVVPAADAVPALIAAMAEHDWRVSWPAAAAAGMFGAESEPAIPALIGSLGDGDPESTGPPGNYGAARALAALGAPAVPGLIAALAEGFGGVFAACTLQMMGPPVFPELAKACRHDSASVREWAARCLKGDVHWPS